MKNDEANSKKDSIIDSTLKSRFNSWRKDKKNVVHYYSVLHQQRFKLDQSLEIID